MSPTSVSFLFLSYFLGLMSLVACSEVYSYRLPGLWFHFSIWYLNTSKIYPFLWYWRRKIEFSIHILSTIHEVANFRKFKNKQEPMYIGAGYIYFMEKYNVRISITWIDLFFPLKKLALLYCRAWEFSGFRNYLH